MIVIKILLLLVCLSYNKKSYYCLLLIFLSIQLEQRVVWLGRDRGCKSVYVVSIMYML